MNISINSPDHLYNLKPASHWGYRIVAVLIFAKFRTPWKLRGISGQPGEIPIYNR